MVKEWNHVRKESTRRTSEIKGEEGTKDWRRIHYEEFFNL
jgi:hypothetical protein